MKYISILGSTGSIGTQTLDIVRENNDIKVLALSAGKNIDLLEKQIIEFRPILACIENEEPAKELELRLIEKNIKDCKIVFGMQGLLEAACIKDVSMVVTAIVGMIGILPTIKAIESGKDIALANKETLCCAGHIIMPLAKEKGIKIFPVDSEHSAIFQCIQGNDSNKIAKILLTASGGPFRTLEKKELEKVTLEDALKHPNWSMGKKITIDSSTMVNKGLEVIEAKWLFDISPENIEVVIQPTSIIHSMVEYDDGAVIAQLGTPDMRLPIQYALFYPKRIFLKGERLDFYKISEIKFEKPDMDKFEGLYFAYEVIKKGGSLPTVYNAANEYAVSLFLKEQIRYIDIVKLIEYALNEHEFIENPTLEQILSIEKEVKLHIDKYIGNCI